MSNVDVILERFTNLNAQKEHIDSSRESLCYPGANVGCCVYPEPLMLEFVKLDESLLEIASDPSSISVVSDERVLTICESLVSVISYHLVETGQTDALLTFLIRNETHFANLPQAKTAKMLRNVLERVASVVKDLNVLYTIFVIYRNWCASKHRTFLKVRLELKLIVILILLKKYKNALAKCESVALEIKALDDKNLSLDLLLIQAKLHLLLRNTTRMKICISNAKNIATNITVPTYVTAEIDLLSGILYMCQQDYKTAYSFLFESYQGFYMSLAGPHSYLYPVRRKDKSVPIDLACANFPLGCHPTTSDLSAVFLTFYNLHEYSETLKCHTDAVGNFYNQFRAEYPIQQSPVDADDQGIGHSEAEDFELDIEIDLGAANLSSVDLQTLARADERKLVQSLKYLLLSMVLNGRANEIQATLSQKNKLKFTSRPEIIFIQKIGACYTTSDLVAFESLLTEFANMVALDPVLEAEVKSLYDALFERNILRVLAPYSRVQCSFVALKLKLDVEKVERKLAEMILDGKLNATIDQGTNSVEIYDSVGQHAKNLHHKQVFETIESMTSVIDTLYTKAKVAI